jgi:general secretion pathway protein E
MDNLVHSLFAQELRLRGKISLEDLQRALEVQQNIGGHLGAILVRLGVLSEETMLNCWSEAVGIPLLKVTELPIDLAEYQQWLNQLGINLTWMMIQSIIIFPPNPQQIAIVMRLGQNPSAFEYTQKQWQLFAPENAEFHIQQYIARSETIETFLSSLQEHIRDGGRVGSSESHLRELAEEAPVIELVNSLFAQAADKGASDIHIDPQKGRVLLRFRIDGVLYPQPAFSSERFNAVVSRIKLLGNMDIAERRLPQDGRISIKASGKSFDVRVSTLPGIHGETIVMRLLPTEKKTLSLANLGMHADHVATFERLIRKPHGIFLVTGPTGSGKTTTLYTALDLVNDGRKKIITVEDPVEYQMENIAQVQVNSEIGLTFASALRTILRQDPDIVMLGEIRDLETAEIAVQASLTGHLVFSTLHTNDAIGAFTRLVDMGVDPFLVATPIIGVMAQRLVRGLCLHCSQPAQLEPSIFKRLEQVAKRCEFTTTPNIRQAGDGCSHCAGTGYAGRRGIYELVEVSESIRDAVIRKESNSSLWATAQAEGIRKLQEDGLLKVWQGQTSLEEVLRVTTD